MATQALIEVNGVPGSNDDLPINALVQLSNQDLGGETTYQWAILDQPTGAADALSAANIENPTFTPKKEGTYLLQLIVNFSLPTEQLNRAVVAVRQLKTRERIPAAGETNEDSAARGWANAVNSLYQRIDALLSDPGIIIGANTSGSSLTRGDVVRVTSGQVIKSGLPGQETVPGFVKAPASTLGNVDELLCVIESNVVGNATVLAGELAKARYIGRLASISFGSGAVGDPIYVSDTATISSTPGTYRRQVGSIMSVSGGLRDFWFDGVGGADITPIDRAYLLYGAPSSGMLFAHRIDGVNATPGATGGLPYLFKAGDGATAALAARRFDSISGDVFQAQTEAGALLSAIRADGTYDLIGSNIVRAILKSYNDSTVAAVIKRNSPTQTADLVAVRDETGTALSAVKPDGTYDLIGSKIVRSILRSYDNTTVAGIARRFSGAQTADLFQFQSEAAAVLTRVNAAGGVDIGLGLNVGFLGTPTQSVLAVGDAAFGLDFTTPNIPSLVFDSTVSRVNYSRVSSAWTFITQSATKAVLRGIGAGSLGNFTLGGGSLLSIPFHVQESFVTPLAAGVGASSEMFRLDTTIGPNSGSLRSYRYRHVATGDWFGASSYLHEAVDGVHMGFVRFSGLSALVGIGTHVGLGVGAAGATPVLFVTATDVRSGGDVIPFTSLVSSIGNITNRWATAWANLGIFTQNITHPANQIQLASRSVQNNVLAVLAFSSVGGIYDLNNVYNVFSLTRTGVGAYTVVFDVPVRQNTTPGNPCPCVASVTPRGSALARTGVGLINTAGTACDIGMFNSAGAVSDSNGQLAVFGAPNALP